MDNKPILILNASTQPYISLGVKFGGIIVNGIEYTYITEHDAFLDKKYLKKYHKHIKAKGTFEQFMELIEKVSPY